jgi:hypothetical protein
MGVICVTVLLFKWSGYSSYPRSFVIQKNHPTDDHSKFDIEQVQKLLWQKLSNFLVCNMKMIIIKWKQSINLKNIWGFFLWNLHIFQDINFH